MKCGYCHRLLGLQPIETCPDDVLEALLFWRGSFVVGSRWDAGDEWTDADCMPQNATHWMPLPKLEVE